LLPRQPNNRPVRVSLKNIEFVAFDRERQTRGWWVQTEPRRRKSQGAFYWLQEAADPSLHVQSRAVLALNSAILDVVSVNDRAPSQPVTLAMGEWFATMAERGVDAKSVLVRFQNEVYTHIVRARPKLTPSCTFLKTLTSLKKQKQKKVLQDVTHFCTVAEEVSGRFPWGGELRMKRNVDLPIGACRNRSEPAKDQLNVNDDDDDDEEEEEEEEEFEMPLSTVRDSRRPKTVKRRRVTTACGSSSGSASGEQGSKKARGEQGKKKTGLVGRFDTDSSDSFVDSEKRKPYGRAQDPGMSTRRQTQTATVAVKVASSKAIPTNSKPPEIKNSAESGSIALTSRVEVFWPLEKCYYSGVVDKIGKRRFHVHYDDGDEGWVDFDTDDYRSLEPPIRTPKAKPAPKARVAERESHIAVPPSSELDNAGRLEATSDVNAARSETGISSGPVEVLATPPKVRIQKKAPSVPQSSSGKKRKIGSSSPVAQGASIATTKRLKDEVSKSASPASVSLLCILHTHVFTFVSHGIEQSAPNNEGRGGTASTVHRQGGPISEKGKHSCPRDSLVSSPSIRPEFGDDAVGEKSMQSSHPTTADKQGGHPKKKLGAVDRAASNPITRSQEARSSEKGDPTVSKTNVKTAKGSSTTVRSHITPLQSSRC
jgi:hypothetical protein